MSPSSPESPSGSVESISAMHAGDSSYTMGSTHHSEASFAHPPALTSFSKNSLLGSTAVSNRRRNRHLHRPRNRIPAHAEIIEIDDMPGPTSFPEPQPHIKAEPIDTDIVFIKSEPIDTDIVFIKSEPNEATIWRPWEGASGSGKDPILLDDSDDNSPLQSLSLRQVAPQFEARTFLNVPMEIDEPFSGAPVANAHDIAEQASNDLLVTAENAPPRPEIDSTQTENQIDTDPPKLTISGASPHGESPDSPISDTPSDPDAVQSVQGARKKTKAADPSFRNRLKLAQMKAAARLKNNIVRPQIAVPPQSVPEAFSNSLIPNLNPSPPQSTDPFSATAALDNPEVMDVDEDDPLMSEEEEADGDSDYDSEREYNKLNARYQRVKAKFEKKVAAGKATDEDEVNMLKLNSEFDARRKKRRLDQLRNKEEEARFGLGDDDDDEPLFEPTSNGMDRFHAPIDSDDDDPFADNHDEGPSKRPNGGSMSNSNKAATSGTTDENELAFLVENHLHGKRRRTTKGGKSKAKETSKKKRSGKTKEKKSNDKVKDPKAKVSKMRTKKNSRKRPEQPSLMDIGSLWTGNVIRDAQGNQGLESLPVIDSHRKHQALKKLVASVPQENRKVASADKNYLLAATRDFTGRGSCKTVPGKDGWLLKGMISQLKHHQMLGSAFMRRRETGDDEPKGGLCADQMGLGKTVMALANIVNGRPSPDQHGPKTTLIVATPALASQWFREIDKHCDKKYIGHVLKHFGKNRLETNDSVQTMMQFDIVLTTYDEVRKSYPKVDFPIELQTSEDKSRWWKKYFDTNRGLLHKVDFLRIVLDEAQYIKNHKSWTSIAARGLQAKHRWALSGTPIQNSVQELYPYFKFLRVPHTGSYKIFCANFTNNGSGPSRHGMDRLHALLSRFMIRRTHGDQILGAKIINLPKASEKIHWCHFNEVERAVYETVRARMIQRINRLSRSKELDSNYSHILTMLLRLRQLTGHILMLEQPLRDLLTREDHEKLKDLSIDEDNATRTQHRAADLRELRRLIELSPSTNSQLPKPVSFAGVRHDAEIDQETARRARAESVVSIRDSTANIGRSHGLKYDFITYLKTLREGQKWEELRDRTVCVLCDDKPEIPWVTSCYHIYCKPCLESHGQFCAEQGMIASRCKECGVEYENSKACDNFDLITLQSMTDPDTEDSDREGLRAHKKKKRENRHGKDWIDQAGLDILPSSKTIAIKAQIINWLEQDPSVKIIIYTQFIDMIRILSKICQVERWVYSTYHGGKSHEARDKAIKEFSDRDDLRILLCSLKAGGIGLNLTMAQKVIVVDPWWNSSIEQQAFCRVFRIGQEQETSMTRFVVKKTVDENMIKMQERKQQEIDEVMDGNERKKLSVPELLRLFGDVEEDEDGQPFILVEDRPTLPNPGGDDDDDEMYMDEA